MWRGSSAAAGSSHPPPATSSSSADVTVLGRVRSAKVNHKSVKKAFPIHKKAFWVARQSLGQLECYENDQAPLMKGVIHASQVKTVSYATDKQNKFFDLSLMLRGGMERRFRLSSREERDRWYHVLSTMVTKHSSQSQWQSILALIHRRLSAASAETKGLLRFDVEVDGVSCGELSSSASSHDVRQHALLQYCVEAADVGIEFALLVDKMFTAAAGGKEAWSNSDRPFVSVTLSIHMIAARSALQQSHSPAAGDVEGQRQRAMEYLVNAGTRYDPVSRQLIVAIIVAEDEQAHDPAVAADGAESRPVSTGDVQFHHLSPQSVVNMLQSNLWRNPAIEGWVMHNPATRSSLERIWAMLRDGSPRGGTSTDRAPSPFTVSMQWGHHMDAINDAQLEAYLTEHVTSDLLEKTWSAISSLCHIFAADEVVRIEAVSVSTGSSSSSFPSAGAAEAGSMGDVRLPAALQCFKRFLRGIAVRLDCDAILTGRPPDIEVVHTMGAERELNTALVIITNRDRRENAFGYHTPAAASGWQGASMTGMAASFASQCPPWQSTTDSPTTSLAEQLRSIVLVARLGAAINHVDKVLSQFAATRDGCCVNWEGFADGLLSFRSVSSADLPKMAVAFGDHYAVRLARLRAQLQKTPAGTVPSGGRGSAPEPWGGRRAVEAASAGSLFDVVFVRCVSTIIVEFVTTKNTETATEPLEPTIRSGVMCDVVHLWESVYAARAASDEQESQPTALCADLFANRVPSPASSPPSFTYAFPSLAPWIRGYFSNPANLLLAPDRHVAADDGDSGASDTDEDGADALHGLDFGNAVATERRIEAQVLSVTQVINIVYDTQRGCDVGMKVGSNVIREAIDALQRLFAAYGPISKHWLIEILSSNLERLRQLYTTGATVDATDNDRSSSDHTARLCTRDDAERILVRFCEYPVSEKLIGPALDTIRVSRSNNNSATARDGHAVVSIDFELVATAALCVVLPNEARLALLCRRDILWLGLENTGKTMLLNSMRGVSQPTHPTIGITETVIAYRELIFACKELGGRPDFRKNGKQYLALVESVHAVVFVVDAAKPTSFGEAADFLREVNQSWSPKIPKKCPLLVLLNNYRSSDRHTPKPQVAYRALQLDKLEAQRPVQYCTCDVSVVHSAHRSVPPNVREGLNWLCQQLAEQNEGQ